MTLRINAAPDAPRILLVDEVDANRCILARLLAHRGYRVSEASCGTVALDFVEQDPPDLVLLELNLSDISGIGVLGALRREFDMCALPIIAMHPEDDSDIAIACFAAGANDFVAKPVQWPLLLARIGMHLDIRRRHFDALHQVAQTDSDLRSRLIARIDSVLKRDTETAPELTRH